jgi:hypothetical protein
VYSATARRPSVSAAPMRTALCRLKLKWR